MLSTKKAKGLALTLAAISIVGAAASAGGSASADPKQYDAPFVGVGSDTTQDLFNAFAGFENGVNYAPLQTDAATGQKQVVSWDATAGGLTTTCITSRTGGPSFNRPNGSGAGRSALLSTITAGGTTSNTNCGTGTTSASGQLSFARSSSLSGTAGTTLAYVPFARDALSYGYYRKAGSPVTSLSVAQLQSIFTSATGATIGGVKIYGCDIQASSGTGTTWRTKMGVATPFTTTTVCDGAINPATGVAFGTSQENDGDALVARGDAVDAIDPGAQVIIGFSVGGYIGKANGVARGGMPATVGIGTISDIATGLNPVTGTAPNLVGDSTFYASSYGRDLYNVLPATVINSAFGNDAIKQLFKGSSSQVCLATTTIQKFGFLPVATCGDSTTIIRGA